MRAGNQAGRGRRLALYIVAALAAVVVLGTSLGLMGYIDQKLKQGAEQQVVKMCIRDRSKKSRFGNLDVGLGRSSLRGAGERPGRVQHCTSFGVAAVAKPALF